MPPRQCLPVNNGPLNTAYIIFFFFFLSIMIPYCYFHNNNTWASQSYPWALVSLCTLALGFWLFYFVFTFPIPAHCKVKVQPLRWPQSMESFSAFRDGLDCCQDGYSIFCTCFVLGNMNFSVSAQAVRSPELCGNKVAEVPEIGRKDTVIKTLLVEVSLCYFDIFFWGPNSKKKNTVWTFLR